jgi:hypothetical protein
MRSKLYLLAVSTLLLIFILCGTTIDQQVPACNVRENRSLASWPSLSFHDLWSATYFKQIDRYATDRFPLRGCIIQLKHAIDLNFFNTAQKNLIIGRDGFVFYREIAQLYVAASREQFPYARWRHLLLDLNSAARRDKKTLVLLTFRNKEYMLANKMPGVWQLAYAPLESPLRKVQENARRDGLMVLDYSDDLQKASNEARQIPFSSLEENHYSPNAFFIILRKLIRDLGRLKGVELKGPREFPRKVSEKIYTGGGFRSVHYENTNFSAPVQWSQERPRRSAGGGLISAYFEYRNKSKSARLGRVAFYTDSFIETLAREFSPLFLPYFKGLYLHWTEGDLDGWQRADTVIIALSDQNGISALSWLEPLRDALLGRASAP